MKRIILIILIIIILAILGFAGYYIYTRYFTQPLTNTNTELTNQFFVVNTNSNGAANQNTNSTDNQPQINVNKDDNGKIQLLGKVFGQNYGSYSNQGSLTNFDEIYGFMGEKMKKWVETTYKNEIIQQHPRNVYYAISTKVLFVKINEIAENNNTAIVLLKTQRQEFIEKPDNARVFYQDLLLNVIKVNDNWVVDSAYWQ